MFVSLFDSVTAPVAESFKRNGCSEDLHKCSNFPLAFTGALAMPWGPGVPGAMRILQAGNSGPAAEQASAVFPYRK